MKTIDTKFGQCLYFASNTLARKMEKLAEESWSRVDLAPSHAYLLLLVLERPGIQPSGIAEELRLQPSTITRLVEKLEEKKLLVRTREGKLTNIYPTPKAKDLLPEMNRCVKHFAGKCVEIFDGEKMMNLVKQMGDSADKLK